MDGLSRENQVDLLLQHMIMVESGGIIGDGEGKAGSILYSDKDLNHHQAAPSTVSSWTDEEWKTFAATMMYCFHGSASGAETKFLEPPISVGASLTATPSYAMSRRRSTGNSITFDEEPVVLKTHRSDSISGDASRCGASLSTSFPPSKRQRQVANLSRTIKQSAYRYAPPNIKKSRFGRAVLAPSVLAVGVKGGGVDATPTMK
jgi:hypothetical protein